MEAGPSHTPLPSDRQLVTRIFPASPTPLLPLDPPIVQTPSSGPPLTPCLPSLCRTDGNSITIATRKICISHIFSHAARDRTVRIHHRAIRSPFVASTRPASVHQQDTTKALGGRWPPETRQQSTTKELGAPTTEEVTQLAGVQRPHRQNLAVPSGRQTPASKARRRSWVRPTTEEVTPLAGVWRPRATGDGVFGRYPWVVAAATASHPDAASPHAQ